MVIYGIYFVSEKTLNANKEPWTSLLQTHLFVQAELADLVCKGLNARDPDDDSGKFEVRKINVIESDLSHF